MSWKGYHSLLAAAMVVFGAINTLSIKWSDKILSAGINGSLTRFHHPFIQAFFMFLGEFMFLFGFFIIRAYNRKMTGQIVISSFNPFIFFPPAACDVIATSILCIGLNFTIATSFQMLRGALLLFTAAFSGIFLHRNVTCIMWTGIFLVLCGLAAVGVSDFLFGKNDIANRNYMITGDELIVIAQAFTAAQLVYEDRVISKYNIPVLQAIGWEGFFSSFLMLLLFVPLYYIHVNILPHVGTSNLEHLENIFSAFMQLKNNVLLILLLIAAAFSLPLFNTAGLSMTRERGATSRAVFGTLRTVPVWIFSSAIGWESFSYSNFFCQLCGFLLLLIGNFIYSGILCQRFHNHTKAVYLVVPVDSIENDDQEPLLYSANVHDQSYQSL